MGGRVGREFPKISFPFLINVLLCVKSLQSRPTLYDPLDCVAHRLLCGLQAGILEWVALLQGIFLTQESNPSLLCLLPWHVSSLPLVPPVTVYEEKMGNRAVN